MAVRVLGIAGSPRRYGNSETLLDKALEGAASRGAQVEKVVLSELNILPCINCDLCAPAGICPFQDDMQPLYLKMQWADRLIIAAPVFFLSLPAQLKAMIDRCQALWVAKYRLGLQIERSSHQRLAMFISVSNASRAREFTPSIAVFKSFIYSLGYKYHSELLVGGVERLGDISKQPKALENAHKLGAALAAGTPPPAEFLPGALAARGAR